MEEAKACECHCDAVFIARFDNIVIADRAARLCDVRYTASVSAFDVVAEREERIGTERYARERLDPMFFLFARKRLRFFGEELLPYAFCENVHIIIGNVDVDRVVAVGATDRVFEREREHLRMLAEPPDISFVAGKARAMYAGLLACTDTDSLTVFGIADGVRLRVFERDKSDKKVAACFFREVFVRRRAVFKECFRDLCVVARLRERDAEQVFFFDFFRNVVRVDLDDIVRAFTFRFEDSECFVCVTRCDHAVGYFASEHRSRFFVAYIGECNEVAVGRHAVCTTRTSVSRCERSELQVIYIIDLFECIGKRKTYCRTCRADVFERSCRRKTCCFFQFFDELPAVERIKEVDVAGTTVENFDRKFCVVFHVDLRRALVRVATIFEHEFFHYFFSFAEIAERHISCHIAVIYSFIIRCKMFFCQSWADDLCYNNNKGGYDMETCTLCPRMCNIMRKQTNDDIEGTLGYCKMSRTVRLAKAMLHEWEEPCISGSRGSGAVFFSGCHLGCTYCQNHDIADGHGKDVTVERLREIYGELVAKGAHNINLVTASHYLDSVIESLDEPLPVPVVYNCGGYERVESLRRLEGKVQIYLPDMKYMDSRLARAYSHAEDYPRVAKDAIREMVRQVGAYAMDDDGILQRGVVIRHLLLPGAVENTKRVIDWVASEFPSHTVLFSLMRQYTPCRELPFPALNRRVTDEEYQEVEDYLFESGIEDGFVQEEESADAGYIPQFDLSGI